MTRTIALAAAASLAPNLVHSLDAAQQNTGKLASSNPVIYKGRAKHIIKSLMAAGHTRKDARLILTRAVREGQHGQDPAVSDAHKLSRQVARWVSRKGPIERPRTWFIKIGTKPGN